jgi:hypothetical protein
VTRAGLALLRDSSAWIGVKRDGGTNRMMMVNGLAMDSNWNTNGFGAERASASTLGSRIWSRFNADIRPGTARQRQVRHRGQRRDQPVDRQRTTIGISEQFNLIG